jgi:hypothetical protein
LLRTVMAVVCRSTSPAVSGEGEERHSKDGL